jgi:hypothetical protein
MFYTISRISTKRISHKRHKKHFKTSAGCSIGGFCISNSELQKPPMLQLPIDLLPYKVLGIHIKFIANVLVDFPIG